MSQREKLWIESKHRYAHEFAESGDDFRLADGRPLWHAFLENPDVLVMIAAEANEAKGKLRELFRTEPNVVRKRVGGSLEEARRMLRRSAP
jgi:hypothetical protein